MCHICVAAKMLEKDKEEEEVKTVKVKKRIFLRRGE